MKISIGSAALLAIAACSAGPTSAQADPQPGDSYELSLDRETSGESSDGSTSSSTDRDAIVERVITVRQDGLELEYDLPGDATAEDRAAVWQFPARIFRPNSGPMQLLNRAELEARIDKWLKAANWTREICGHWIFTWNAFQIDCDPQSVLQTIATYDLRLVELREGAAYDDKQTLGPGSLVRKVNGSAGNAFSAELRIDPEAVRRERAESDVAAGEIMRKPMTLEAALKQHAADVISGTVVAMFEADAAGNVTRRTRVAKIQVKRADGVVETSTITETLNRKLISKSGS